MSGQERVVGMGEEQQITVGRVTPSPQQAANNAKSGQFKAILILLLVAILGVVSFSAFAGSPSAKTTWEYKIEAVSDLEFDSTMKALGDDGWELVLGRRARDSMDDMMYECVFKRPN